jgi:hypothetical protein
MSLFVTASLTTVHHSLSPYSTGDCPSVLANWFHVHQPSGAGTVKLPIMH